MTELFNNGDQGSASKLFNQLLALQTQGQGVIDSLSSALSTTLVEFSRRLEAINARRSLAHRISTEGVYAKFPVTDFLTVDQGLTTATIRSDAGAATLRERQQPAEATIKTNDFSATTGTVETIDPTTPLYSVTTFDGSIPTGQFDIELVIPLAITLIVFDISATPSSPTVAVSVSADGVSYTNATQVALNGYRVSAWLPVTEVRFIRIQITPVIPDSLSGSTYTFGITSFSATVLDFNLRSDVLSQPVVFTPYSLQCSLSGDVDPNITYFLSLQSDPNVAAPLVEVTEGASIDIPGTASVVATGVSTVAPSYIVFSNSLVVSLAQFIRPTVSNGYVFEVTTPGTLQGTGEPVWPTTAGQVITSGTAQLTARPDGTFQNSVYYPASMLIRPSTANGFVYQVTTPGTSQPAGEPIWPLIPGDAVVSGGVTFTTQLDGILTHILPANTYLNTIVAVEEGPGTPLRVAPNLTSDPNTYRLVNKYLGAVKQNNGTWFLYLLRYVPAEDIGKTFMLTYITGPATVTAQLKVRLSTEDRVVTPVFHGATLQAV